MGAGEWGQIYWQQLLIRSNVPSQRRFMLRTPASPLVPYHRRPMRRLFGNRQFPSCEVEQHDMFSVSDRSAGREINVDSVVGVETKYLRVEGAVVCGAECHSLVHDDGRFRISVGH